MTLQVQLLNGFRVVRPDGTVMFPKGRQGQVLAALALLAPDSARKDRLAAGFWPPEKQPTDTTIEAIVHELRDGIGPDGHSVVATAGPAYKLDLSKVDLDTELLADLVAQGQYEQAVSLWRADPAVHLGETFVWPELENRLQILRSQFERAAIEMAELHFANERYRDTIAAVQGFWRDAEQSQRLNNERAVELYVRSLYSDGRRLEALARLKSYQEELRDEHGLDLGKTLASLLTELLDGESVAISRSVIESSGTQAGHLDVSTYWGYRPDAHSDIRATLLACKSEIVIAGQGLTTVEGVLNDPAVVKRLAATPASDPVSVTLVFSAHPSHSREAEAGGSRLREKVERGLASIRELRDRLRTSGSAAKLEARQYAADTTPRHFFLKVDDTLYVGSYLTHEQGSRSYLMKLAGENHGLYALMSAELEHVLGRTIPFDLDSPLDREETE